VWTATFELLISCPLKFSFKKGQKKSRKNVLKPSETRNLFFINNPLNPVADVLNHPVCLSPAASSDHSTDNMQVSVIRTGFSDTTGRRCFEARMIFSHHIFHPRGLNTVFAFISHS